MTTDVLALREARERLGLTLREAAPRLGIDFTYLSKVENGHERPSDALLLRMCDLYGLEPDAVVLARAVAEVPPRVRDALIAAVRSETLAGSGVVSMAAVQKAVGILRDYSHGEECAVYAEDDDLVDVYDDPTNEACDCGLRDLILTLTGALPDVGATALALVATPPTPPLTAARLAVAMHETTMGCANHGSDWHSYHIGVARILFAALVATPPTPALTRVEKCAECGLSLSSGHFQATGHRTPTPSPETLAGPGVVDECCDLYPFCTHGYPATPPTPVEARHTSAADASDCTVCDDGTVSCVLWGNSDYCRACHHRAQPATPARERGWARDCYCNAEYPGCTDPDCSCSHHAPPTPALTAERLAERWRGYARHRDDCIAQPPPVGTGEGCSCGLLVLAREYALARPGVMEQEPYYLLPPIPPLDWDKALWTEWAINGGLTDEGLERLRALIDPATIQPAAEARAGLGGVEALAWLERYHPVELDGSLFLCGCAPRWFDTYSDVLRHHLAALAATSTAPAVERSDPERLLDAIEAQAIGEVEA